MINKVIFLRQSNFCFVSYYRPLDEYKPWEKFVLFPNWHFVNTKQIIGESKI